MVTYSVQASHGDYWHDSVVMSDNCHMCSCGSFDDAKFIASRLNAHDALVAALEFYADPKNWIDTPSWDGDPQCFTPGAVPVSDDEDGRPCDCGRVARATLARSSQVEQP